MERVTLQTEEDRAKLIRELNQKLLVNRIIITGGPHSGKTTLIEALEKRGVGVLQEAAIQVIRDLIERQGERGFSEWRKANFAEFQQRIFWRHLENERGLTQRLKVKTRVFEDRSAIDCIAYLKAGNAPVPQFMWEYARTAGLDRVFLLDTLTPFDPRSKTGRESAYEDSLRIRDQIISVYKELGYSPELIGQASVEERIARIERAMGAPL